MSRFSWGKRSVKRMEGLHPDLIKVLNRFIVITPIDAAIIEGLRSEARQRKLVEAGASKTMNSRHLTGHAVDVAPWVGGTVRWDWPLFYPLAEAMKKAADQVGVPIEWGGDWRTFKDGPHWQLPWSEYPA